MSLPPGPWRRGHNIDLEDGSYMTRSRCKTGYRIRRCCSRCGKWEVWRHNLPVHHPEAGDRHYGRFSTWRDVMDWLVAEHYGNHDKLAVGWGALAVPVLAISPPKHRPSEDHWDASWLMWRQRLVIGFDGVTDFLIYDPWTGRHDIITT